MGVVFSCGFEHGTSSDLQLAPSRPPSLRVRRHIVDGIYDYDYTERNTLLVTRKYKDGNEWVTESVELQAGQSAWGWEWNGLSPQEVIDGLPD